MNEAVYNWNAETLPVDIKANLRDNITIFAHFSQRAPLQVLIRAAADLTQYSHRKLLNMGQPDPGIDITFTEEANPGAYMPVRGELHFSLDCSWDRRSGYTYFVTTYIIVFRF